MPLKQFYNFLKPFCTIKGTGISFLQWRAWEFFINFWGTVHLRLRRLGALLWWLRNQVVFESLIPDSNKTAAKEDRIYIENLSAWESLLPPNFSSWLPLLLGWFSSRQIFILPLNLVWPLLQCNCDEMI